jgi:hypothetical protein
MESAQRWQSASPHSASAASWAGDHAAGSLNCPRGPAASVWSSLLVDAGEVVVLLGDGQALADQGDVALVGVVMRPGPATVGGDLKVVADERATEDRVGLGLVGDLGDPQTPCDRAVVAQADQFDVLAVVEVRVEAVGVPGADDDARSALHRTALTIPDSSLPSALKSPRSP